MFKIYWKRWTRKSLVPRKDKLSRSCSDRQEN